jgi:hypothetical protein
MAAPEGQEVCLYHIRAEAQTNFSCNWGHHNAIWGDYFHRRVEIPRLHPQPLTDDVWNVSLSYCAWPLPTMSNVLLNERPAYDPQSS